MIKAETNNKAMALFFPLPELCNAVVAGQYCGQTFSPTLSVDSNSGHFFAQRG